MQRRLRQRVHAQQQSPRDGHRAERVEAAPRHVEAALGDDPPCEQQRGRTDRDVEVEDVLPADVTGQQAARDQADGRAAGRDGAPGAERFVALRTLREDVHHDRQRSRQHDRRPQSLDAAHHDQESVGRRQRAGERRGGEEREADHHHAPTPEQVRSSAAEQQESSEREPVRGDNPLQVRLAEVQLATDRRQSHVHDRQVDDRHEVRDREHGERAPAMHTLFGNRGLGYSDHKNLPFENSSSLV